MEYDSRTFISIASITALFTFFGVLTMLVNIFSHLRVDYSPYRKQPLIVVFSISLLWMVLLFVSLWIYPHAEPVLILIQLWIGTNLAIIYKYMKETIMFYTTKSIKEKPQEFALVIKDEKIKEYMLNQEYPMAHQSFWGRMILGDYFTAYLYLLEGKICFWFCCLNIRVNNFRKSLKYQYFRTWYVWIYVILIPSLHLLDFLNRRLLTFRPRMTTMFVQPTIIFLNLWTVLTVKAFSVNFKHTMKFENFKVQIMVVQMIGLIFNITHAVLTLIRPEIDNFSEEETINLLFIPIISFFFTLFSIFQRWAFDSKNMSFQMKDPRRTVNMTYSSKINAH